MDRDVVSLIHFMYHHGPIDWSQHRPLVWCGADTPPALDAYLDDRALPPQLYRFLKAVDEQMSNLPRPDYVFSFPLKNLPRAQGDRRPCFVAMPYRVPWFRTVADAVRDAATASGFDAEISGDLATPGPIPDQIWQGIRRAEVVIADVAGANPNVYYEVGMAHALGKELVVLTQDDPKTLPFDIQSSRSLRYDPADPAALRSSLEAAFAAVSARYPFEGPEPRF
jgi:hypothetical protein